MCVWGGDQIGKIFGTFYDYVWINRVEFGHFFFFFFFGGGGGGGGVSPDPPLATGLMVNIEYNMSIPGRKRYYIIWICPLLDSMNMATQRLSECRSI